jgi:hypothetical protein
MNEGHVNWGPEILTKSSETHWWGKALNGGGINFFRSNDPGRILGRGASVLQFLWCVCVYARKRASVSSYRLAHSSRSLQLPLNLLMLSQQN